MNKKAQVLPTHTLPLFEAAVRRAAELLRAGEVVALPTETVYGLAANAFDTSAVERIFQIKGRPAHNPIIVHVASLAMARRCVAHWPAQADRLARAFWPGPLTLVLPRANAIPDIVTAGGPTVGVRWPGHPLIQAVIRECDFPLAAPSANLSTSLSPTSAEHVRKSLGDRIPLIVDGGQCQVGLESTVLDLSVSPPRLLRPGMIHEPALRAVLDEVALRPRSASGGASERRASERRDAMKCEALHALTLHAPTPRSPGLLPKHYSPKAKLVVLCWSDEANFKSQISNFKSEISKIHVIAHSHIPSGAGLSGVSVIPHDPPAFARALYAELHRADEAGAELIIVEAVPETDEWRGIADRLKRASFV